MSALRLAGRCQTSVSSRNRCLRNNKRAPWLPAAQQAARRRPLRAAAGKGGSSETRSNQQLAAEEDVNVDDGKMLQLDPSSSTSLDGSEDAPFGPLVRMA